MGLRKLSVFLIFFLLLSARRGAQLLYPEVWSEDGSVVLYEYIRLGWLSAFRSINGYLLLIPKLISGLAYYLSFYYYPIISTVITWLFISWVGCVITFSPSFLPYPFLMALALFLVPTDPEVFGLPAYTFWWSSMLLVLACFHKFESAFPRKRIIYILLAGLSSPFVVAVLPLLALRCAGCPKESRRSEAACFLAAVFCSFAQLYYVMQYPSTGGPWLNIPTVSGTVASYFGGYFTAHIKWPGDCALYAGWALIALLVFLCWKTRANILVLGTLYFLLATIALSLFRSKGLYLHPGSAGPRYFFYPYVFISWTLLVSLSLIRERKYKIVLSCLLALSVINSIPVFWRTHADLDWQGEISKCLAYGDNDYSIPLHTTGDTRELWYLKVSGTQCARILERDPGYNLLSKPVRRLPFIYIGEFSPLTPDDSFASSADIIQSGWRGTDIDGSFIPEFQAIGSHIATGRRGDKKSIRLKLKKNQKIIYRNGPGLKAQKIYIPGTPGFLEHMPVIRDWSILEFSNPDLPAEFEVVFADESIKAGEWSAVALRHYNSSQK